MVRSINTRNCRFLSLLIVVSVVFPLSIWVHLPSGGGCTLLWNDLVYMRIFPVFPIWIFRHIFTPNKCWVFQNAGWILSQLGLAWHVALWCRGGEALQLFLSLLKFGLELLIRVHVLVSRWDEFCICAGWVGVLLEFFQWHSSICFARSLAVYSKPRRIYWASFTRIAGLWWATTCFLMVIEFWIWNFSGLIFDHEDVNLVSTVSNAGVLFRCHLLAEATPRL